MINNVFCPICSSKPVVAIELSAGFIKNKLEDHFKKSITSNLDINDYSLCTCTNCSFQFAFPFIEGSSSFYDWITEQSSYYPSTRWEYSKLISFTERAGKSQKLIDIGCGDGRFLDFIQGQNTDIDYYGLDTTQISINKCSEKGHKVFCMDVKEFKQKYVNECFDIVTAFHVLEHIANPKQFISELVSLLNKGGFILISTPYSPMDFELDWFDVLNHPPHHMGRWNMNSYNEISEQLNLHLEIFMPQNLGILASAVSSFIFSNFGNSNKIDKIKVALCILKKPLNFLNHLLKQGNREKVSGKRASNTILVKLSPKI